MIVVGMKQYYNTYIDVLQYSLLQYNIISEKYRYGILQHGLVSKLYVDVAAKWPDLLL